MKFCCLYLMVMSGWLPPCHEGRTASQIVSCFQFVRAQVRWHICTHLHCYSLFQYRDKKGFQSHIHFACPLAPADVAAVLTSVATIVQRVEGLEWWEAGGSPLSVQVGAW